MSDYLVACLVIALSGFAGYQLSRTDIPWYERAGLALMNVVFGANMLLILINGGIK
jgi:hypothetical protein